MSTLFQDDFGTVTHDADKSILTLTWFEKTANMTDENFQVPNLAFAVLTAEHKISKLIVNVEKFKHKFGPELGGWRTRNILPIYARAGVTKFAFVHGIGYTGPTEGSMEGENFVTQRYATREEAVAWLLT